MAFDRHVLLDVTFQVRAREDGHVSDEELAGKIARALRQKGPLQVWDGEDGRMTIDLHRATSVEVERVEEW